MWPCCTKSVPRAYLSKQGEGWAFWKSPRGRGKARRGGDLACTIYKRGCSSVFLALAGHQGGVVMPVG